MPRTGRPASWHGDPARRRPRLAAVPRGAWARPRRWLAALAVATSLLGACGEVVRFEVADPIGFVQQPQTSHVLDVDGTVIAELHAEEDRQDVTLDAVAPVMAQAVVAIEDRRFFLHDGVDVAAVARAVVRNLEAEQIEQGGSTITQQYVKNTITGSAVTLERKLQEAAYAWQLEQRYDKVEILERYLNTVYFGKGAYGVHAAARRFFGVDPDALALDQAALLAGMIQSPTRYDPYVHPEAATGRRELVLDAMVETGVATREEADAAAAAALELSPAEQDDGHTFPYVVDEVLRLVQHDPDGVFAAALGPDVDDRVAAVFTGGLRIATTIDPRLQLQAEQAVASVLTEPDDPRAALVAIDPATGAVRAMVGGRDHDDPDDPSARFNLATQARRQPGSAIKPIVLAAALDRGVALDRVFPAGACAEFETTDWRPCNYREIAYPELTLREATVRSANTAYARLAVELGGNAIRQQAASFGISSGAWVPEPSLGLGAGEVSPLDLASAYATLAAGGVHREPHLVAEIRAADGALLWAHQPTEFRVVADGVAYMVTTTLEEVVQRGTGVRAAFGRPLAGKTGTTQNSADAWFAGYTPQLAAAVWVGFPEGQVPMVPPRTRELVEGGRWPAEIFRGFAEQALRDEPELPFPAPDLAIVTVEVDVERNCLPGPGTPTARVAAREFVAGTEPTARCEEGEAVPVSDVPSVEGLPLDVALRLLADAGLEADERPIRSPVYPPGYVTGQAPTPGGAAPGTEPADATDRVVLWVSVISTERQAVVDVTGLPAAEAVAALEADDWVVEVRAGCPPGQAQDDDAPRDTTADQQPSASPTPPTPPTGCALPTGAAWGTTPAAGERERRFSPVVVHVVPDAVRG